MLPWTPPPVLAVVVVGTGIALAAQPRGLLARFCLIVPQDISSLCIEGQKAVVTKWSWSTPTTAETEYREGVPHMTQEGKYTDKRIHGKAHGNPGNVVYLETPL